MPDETQHSLEGPLLLGAAFTGILLESPEDLLLGTVCTD